MKPKTLIISILSVLAFIVLIQNMQVISLRLFFWEVQMSRIIFILLVLLIGAVIGYLLGRMHGASKRKVKSATETPEKNGSGVLLTGDTIKVAYDRRFVSFMYSYPNHVPLAETAIQKIVAAVAPFQFERIYGAWPDHMVYENAKTVVHHSDNRYIRALKS